MVRSDTKKARIISNVKTFIYFAVAISGGDTKTLLIVYSRKVALLFANHDISSNESTV